jgi:hypothetical protein
MFPPHTQCLGVTVSLSLKVTQGSLRWSSSPCRPNVWTWVLTSLMGGTPLTGSWASLGFIVPSPGLAGRMSPSSGSSCSLSPGKMTSPGIWGMHDGDKGGEKHLCNPGHEPWEMFWETEHGTLKKFSRKQCFIVLTQTQWTWVQRLRPKNKEVSPYIPLQASFRCKKQGLTHIWVTCNRIGYFTLVLRDFPHPVLCDPLHI